MNDVITTSTHEQRYRVLIDNAPEAVFILDAETGKFVDFNKKALEFFAHSEQELYTKGPIDLTPDRVFGQEASTLAMNYINEALNGGNPVFNWVHLNGKNQEIPCEVRLIRFPPYDQQLIRASLIDRTDQMKLELALQEKEERLKLAISATGIGSFDLQTTKGELIWDKQMHKLFGLSFDATIDRNEHFFSVLHPEDCKRVVDSYSILMGPESVETYFENEYRIIREGEICHIVTNGFLFRNDKGEVLRSIGTCHEVTEARNREALLKITTKKLNEAQRFAKIGSFEVDFLKRTTWWSEMLYQLFDLSPKDAIPSKELFLQHVHPQDLKFVNQKIDTCVSQGTAQKFEHRLVFGNGKTIKYVNHIIRPVKNGEGKVVGLNGTSQDITEGKQVELALREREEHFRAIFEQSAVSFFIYDMEGRFLDLNQRMTHITGYSKEEILGRSFDELLPNNDLIRTKAKAAFTSLLETGSLHFESEGVRKSGERYPMEITSKVIDVGGKKLISGTGQDLTERKQAERKLRDSEEMFSKAFHQNPNMMVLADIETMTILDVNLAYCQKMGYTKEEVVNSPGKLGFSVVITEAVTDAFNKAKEKNSLSDLEIIALTKEGIQLNGLLFIEPIDIQGKNLYIINIVDISARKQAEEKLRSSEERFRKVFNQQFQFMAILSPEGRILEVNDLPLQVQGASLEDYLGKYFWLSPAWKKLPEWQEIIKKQVLQAATLKGPLITQDTYQTINGDIHYCESAYSSIRDSDNQLRFILVQANDITERKLAEERLKKTQQELLELTNRFQISTQAAKIGIWDWDIKTNLTIWDETMFELYQMEKVDRPLLYEDWKEKIHPDDVKRLDTEVELSLKGVTDFNTEFRLVLIDQSIHHIKAVASVQWDSDGNPIRMIGTNWDITKEKEAERQKIHSRKLELRNIELEQFAYVASHDLKEPLRTVKGFAEVLKTRYEDKLDDNADKYLAFISQAASRMDKLIKALLDYSQIGRNKELIALDCNSVIITVLADLNSQISETNTTFDIGQLPKIKGSETEMRVLFQNLISNAIKFRKSDIAPFIKISAQLKEEHWVFCIKDNGIGIDPEYKEKVFVIFQRLHARNEYEGTGIGLAHCQKIVDLHGGKIWVESTIDKGSQFYFTIPK